MSDAIAVFHGVFGRVCLYAMDRSMAPHGHREGHLIFHVQGPPGEIVVDGAAMPVSAGQAVAVSPWQGHYWRTLDATTPTLALVLYIDPPWFLETSRCATVSMRFGRPGVEVTPHLARLVLGTAQAMLDGAPDDPGLRERLAALTRAAFDQSWQWTEAGPAFTGPAPVQRDWRIRKALRLLQDRLCEGLALDDVARGVGLSRQHFYTLFRAQVGLTPNLYLNALRMERAIELLSQGRSAVSDIGLDLGFASQASFSRFFIANGVVAPSAYRRCVQLPG